MAYLDEQKLAKLLKHSGTISKGENSASKLLLGNDTGALHIVNGSWTSNATIEVGESSKKGTIIVGSGAGAAALALTEDASLKFVSGDVTVGSATTLGATLDFSKMSADKLDVSASTETTVTADNNGKSLATRLSPRNSWAQEIVPLRSQLLQAVRLL